MIRFLFLLLLSCSCFANSMDWAKEQAVSLRKESSFTPNQFQFPEKELNPKGEVFDPDQKPTQSEGQQFLESKKLQNNLRENKGFDENEFFLQETPVTVEGGVEYQIKTCKKSGDPYPLSYTRDLSVKVEHLPEEIEIRKICKGHKEEKKHSSRGAAEGQKKNWERELKANREISSFKTKHWRIRRLGSNNWRSKREYTHKDNGRGCNHFKSDSKVIRKETWKEASEEWTLSGKNAFLKSQSPDCTLVKTNCLDRNRFKKINGKEVIRKCWKEQFSFLCKCTQVNECAQLQAKNCELVSKKCLNQNSFGCSLWEQKFKCFSRTHLSSSFDVTGVYGAGDELSSDPEENDSFAEVVSKLAVFQEMENSLGELSFFSGNKFTCSKSIASDLTYDCCFSYGGLVKSLKLAKCTQDEIHLGSLREDGKCHYCGKHSKKTLGVKTKTIHSFCCFPSKLARVFNEEARKQLGISWGKAESPNCTGLTQDQIISVDFSKLDLSEVYEDYLEQAPGIEKKMEAFDLSLEEVKKKMEESCTQSH